MAAETFWLSTNDGIRLDAVLDRVDAPLAVAVVLHPHPQFGGDRRNAVVQAVRYSFGALVAAATEDPYLAGRVLVARR